MLADCGPIKRIDLIKTMDRETRVKQSRGFGFVSFALEADAAKAVETIHGKRYNEAGGGGSVGNRPRQPSGLASRLYRGRPYVSEIAVSPTCALMVSIYVCKGCSVLYRLKWELFSSTRYHSPQMYELFCLRFSRVAPVFFFSTSAVRFHRGFFCFFS